MRWRDAVGLAARAVLRRPGRAILTVTAVALAAALLTALLAIAATGRTRVLNQLSSGGPLAGIKVSGAPGPFNETMVGVDLTHAGRLPVTVLAGRLPDARSGVEVAVTEGYLKRLGLDKRRAAAVVGTEVVTGAPRAFPGPSGVRLR